MQNLAMDRSKHQPFGGLTSLCASGRSSEPGSHLHAGTTGIALLWLFAHSHAQLDYSSVYPDMLVRWFWLTSCQPCGMCSLELAHRLPRYWLFRPARCVGLSLADRKAAFETGSRLHFSVKSNSPRVCQAIARPNFSLRHIPCSRERPHLGYLRYSAAA